MTFGERLRAAMADRGPLCVGVDPHPGLLHAWDLEDSPAGLERFGRTVVGALGGEVAVLKPQSAFFERHGSKGIAVLERVVAGARDAGAVVVMDAKRGDIGSTVEAYADAYLDPASPLCADAVTASPYLGFGALQPLIDTALAHDNGVFVLALTSNPEGTEVQAAVAGDGRTVAGTILDHVRSINAKASGWGSLGCVVGATVGASAQRLGVDLDVHGPLLAPGLGAQGGTAQDLRAVFGAALPAVLPAVSRAVLAAGPDPDALKAAAASELESVKHVLTSTSSSREQG